MAKFWTCPYCQENLDFGEKCECIKTKEKINRLHDEALNILARKEEEK